MEQWKSISGYEQLYSISDLGRVRIEVTRHNIRQGAMLTLSPAKGGYLYVALRREREKKPRNFHVARLVLDAFIGPPRSGQQANHKNGEVTDNQLHNLEWCSPSENIDHAISTLGHSRKGANNPAAKLTEDDVIQLRKRAASGETYTSLGKRFGISNAMACMIGRGKAWPHAEGPITKGKPRGRPKAIR